MEICPTSLAFSFVRSTLELKNIILNPAVKAGRERFFKFTQIYEESEKDEIEECDKDGKSNDECETEHVDVSLGMLGAATQWGIHILTRTHQPFAFSPSGRVFCQHQIKAESQFYSR